ncbi:MAG: hypothetical protein AABY22_14385, partial [Nanoarchaeota archaeon]
MKRVDGTTARELIQLYNKGFGTHRLAKLFQLHRSSVQALLIRNKIKLRKTSPYYNYDINYFDKYSEDNSYWAGFIMADGCLRRKMKRLEIKASLKDNGHLSKFKKIINFEGDIKTYYNYDSIGIGGGWFYQSLKRNFGITPRKTFTCEFPKNLPKKYWNHFIRGLFDGDGCITFTPCPT